MKAKCHPISLRHRRSHLHCQGWSMPSRRRVKNRSTRLGTGAQVHFPARGPPRCTRRFHRGSTTRKMQPSHFPRTHRCSRPRRSRHTLLFDGQRAARTRRLWRKRPPCGPPPPPRGHPRPMTTRPGRPSQFVARSHVRRVESEPSPSPDDVRPSQRLAEDEEIEAPAEPRRGRPRKQRKRSPSI
jgi:hypothetical protein